MAEKKEYRSAIRSRRLIRQAFLELLREKSFEKITVTEIVKRADINRSTFYAHYPDVVGLVEELINEVVEQSLELIHGLNVETIFLEPGPFITKLVSIGQENMDIYKLLGQSSFALEQTERIQTILLEKAVTEIDLPDEIRRSNPFRIRASFFIGGIMTIYRQWIKGELTCSIDEIAQDISIMLRSSYESYFAEYGIG